MPYSATHLSLEPTRPSIDSLPGPVVLEFGTPWCGHCQGAQPLIRQLLSEQAQVQHLKVEDGPGRPLGRSYRVKLWPTLVFLKNGQELARVVRPTGLQSLQDALALIG
ncbi:thioredoxin family protein [Melaminivora sp.]